MKVLGVSIKGTRSEAKVQVVEDRAQQLRKGQDFGPKAREELLDQLFHVFMARVLCGTRPRFRKLSFSTISRCCAFTSPAYYTSAGQKDKDFILV